MRSEASMATERIGNQQESFHRYECQNEQWNLRRNHGQNARSNAAPWTDPRKRDGIVFLTETIILNSDYRQIKSHQHIGNGQISDNHADRSAFIAMRESAPKHQTVSQAGYHCHWPCGVAKYRLGQQILKGGHTWRNGMICLTVVCNVERITYHLCWACNCGCPECRSNSRIHWNIRPVSCSYSQWMRSRFVPAALLLNSW